MERGVGVGVGRDTFVRISFVPCLITASLPQVFPFLLPSSLLPKTCKTKTMIITSVQKGNVYCLLFLSFSKLRRRTEEITPTAI